MPLVAGVDSSTQSTKVELRDVDSGDVAASGRVEHPPADPPDSEQDPRAWWRALIEALGQCRDHLRDVVAVAVAGQQHGLVVLGADGEPLRPAKLWNDTTSALQAEALVARLGAEAWVDACGSVPVASFTVTKLAWLVEHEPDVVRRIARIALPHDYLTLRLTGAHVTDRGDASGTGWYDPVRGRYRSDLIDLVGGRAGADWVEALPQIMGFDAVAGQVSKAVAESTGLREGTAVNAGTGDNMAAALGLGLRPGDIAMSLGTSGTVYAVSATPSRDPTGAVAGFCDATGNYLPLVCTLNATRVTDLVAGWLGFDRHAFSQAAMSAPAGSNGVVLVPYLDGERTPNLPDASGVLFGIRTDTTRSDLARAAHEGVVCGLLAGVDALIAAGATTGGRLHLTGGGARSRSYRQILAECWGMPLRVPEVQEAVATGACALAAQLAGLPLADVAAAWGLADGYDVEPARVGPSAEAASASIRDRYNLFAGRVGGWDAR